ncbi:Calpain-7 [Lamellibrachia satsuma]|nr:Calpain-7 [Lamellibrachia satsuma]
MADPSTGELKEDAVQFAQRAVKCDTEGLVDTAAFFYQEAANALLLMVAEDESTPSSVVQKANQYLARAKELKSSKADRTSFAAPLKTQQQLDLDRGKFLLSQAFEEDENKNFEEAVKLYSDAVEFFLKQRDQAKESADTDLYKKLSTLAEQALDRAEAIKNMTLTPAPSYAKVPPGGNDVGQPPIRRPLGSLLRDDVSDQGARQRAAPPGGTSGGGGYTREEIQVLRTTSMINGREYVPFMLVDMRERFAYPVPFSDKNGKLTLSAKQRSNFGRWMRPDELTSSPQMIIIVSSFSIKQTIVTDCSFVASLAIAAQYERRFHKKLITSIVFPQNKKGHPVYNPCGKYMVKLNINGVPRKVIIDDYLPVGCHGELLCSYSSNASEMWVSLLEKAYLKVMGGYDFPGSNSNIDLHVLTGWIPERIAIRPNSTTFDADHEFDKILDRFHKGHCLVTMATGDISEVVADRAGLVPTHAYAMLDVRKVKGYRLFLLKNPWSHLRWKGNFSENDSVHWTEDMKRLLNYNPSDAAMFDNGVFWIDYASVIEFFDVTYVNWNPELFPSTTCMHHTWRCKEGPKKDSYNIGDNPQYRLEVHAPGPSAVWILLTRHITDKDDFADNREFITLLVYKSNGKRIFYPYDPPPYKDGVRINSPHYLCKMVEEKGTSLYSLVISQYEKTNTIHYTLRVYATCKFSLTKISEPYTHERQMTGQWKGTTAGGCANFPTHGNNPIYQVKIDNNRMDNQILLELRGPKQYSVGFDLITVSENVPSGSTEKKRSTGAFSGSTEKKRSTGAFRPGFCVLEVDSLSGGSYNIQPSTFHPGQAGPFFLNVSCSSPLTLTQLQ